ncbi:isopeptide-forming domain-containing fimbrial protein [Microbulbifer sp. HZ11]|uniref:isopeptide-forming domain-containing fimbrial protein n=1 Tax=Microbulbifer sp. HZ11 TaxID=1453501 RepID=UPI0005BCDDEA|nr:isopeptide-forming domain-containing fimbrial protein [Microbulbifer sp. HZ11]
MEFNEFSRSSLANAIHQHGRRLSSLHRNLEKRVLLDASVAADVSQAVSPADTDTADGNEITLRSDTQKDKQENRQQSFAGQMSAGLLNASYQAKAELVVIDLQLDDAQALVDDLVQQSSAVNNDGDAMQLTIGERSVTLLTLGASDTLQTVSDLIQQSGQTFDAIHLISHGGAGGIDIGADTLSLASLSDTGSETTYESTPEQAGNNHRAQLQSWSSSLNSGADILLYGCNTGYSLTGEKFIARIADLTGADVAASDDATGSALRGGDWELEQNRGDVETDIIFSKLLQGSWEGLMVATPTATVDGPSEDFINESTDITFTFDNAGDTTGYGPFMDIVLGPGLEVDNVSGLLGAKVETYTYENGQWVDSGGNPVDYHPYDFNQTGDISLPPGEEGATWYAIQLPFGSFTPDQPAYELDVSLLIDEVAGAMVGVPIPIYVRPGFAYGNDPLNNPDTDPAIVAPPIETQITPTVMLVDKVAVDGDGDNASIGDDGETVTGPSEPVTWQVNVDIANMSPVQNLVVTEQVPENFYYQPGTVSVGGAVGSTLVEGTDYTISEPPEGAQVGSELVVTFLTPVEGTLADNDIVITYSGYVPEVDANGNPIVVNDAADDVVLNTASASGVYDSMNISGSDDAQIVATASALQKNVSLVNDTGTPGYTPGDTIEYTLTMQVSDYMSLDNLSVSDLVGDGIEVDPDSISMSLSLNGSNFGPSPVAAGNSSVVINGDGSTTVDVDISQQLIDQGLTDGSLDGDLFADGVTQGTTTITITYEAVIREQYVGPGGSVDALDVIGNQATLTATAVSANGETVENSSSEEIVIQSANSSKSVFAVNDSTDPADLNDISVGDTVTFALEIDLGTIDFEGISVTDYLPLPVFLAQAPTFTDTGNGASIPGVNEWGFGPNTDFGNWPPGYLDGSRTTTSADTGNNSITWDFDPSSLDNSNGGTVQLLFTVQVQDQPFTDGLSLTNVSSIAITNTNGTTVLDPDAVQLEVLSPELSLTKGVVSTNNSNGVFDPDPNAPVDFAEPGTATAPPWTGGLITSDNLGAVPIDSNLSEVDAGDLVRFAITVENTGGSDAFNIAISDILPPGFDYPGGNAADLNLQVYTGSGTALTFSGDLFGSGIVIDDPSSTEGALNQGRDPDAGNTIDGSNIIVITYDLQAIGDVQPNQEIINTATLEAYGGVDEGNDYTEGNSNSNWQDDAAVTIRANTVSKSLDGTSINSANNLDDEAVIGETAEYTLTLTIAEGETPSASILDTLDLGLEYLDIVSVTASADIQNASGNPWSQSDLTITENGQQITFDLGDLTNVNRDNSSTETITITYRVLVQNIIENQSGDTLNNQAEFSWDSTADGVDNPTVQATAAAENITVIEPQLQVEKTLSSASSRIDANDQIDYTVVISHASTSETDAWDATFTDTLPSELGGVTLVSATLDGVDVLNRFVVNGNTISMATNQTFDLLMGQTLTLQFSATVDAFIVPGTTITNVAFAEWTSIEGEDPNERTGVDGLGNLNDYRAIGSNSFTTTSILAEGKQITSSSIEDPFNGLTEVVIGETASYASYFIIPEGEVPLATITDLLPPGLAFVSLDEVIVGSNITSSLGDLTDPGILNPPAEGTTGEIVFSLGTLTNSNASNDAGANTIALLYTVKVLNVESNQAGEVLTNTATFIWDSNDNGEIDPDDQAVSQTADITVIEPQLLIEKSVVPGTGDNGDQVTYTIVAENPGDGSSTTAYDIIFTDQLPDEFEITDFSATIELAGESGNVTNFFIYDEVNNRLVIDPQAELDMLPGTTITLTITGTLANTIAGGEIFNDTDLRWSSLDANGPDGDAGERDGSDGEGNGLNNYAVSDDAVITVNSPTVEKVLVSTSQNDDLNSDSEATIGEVVTFSVTVALPEASITGRITDVYGPGFEFVDLVSIVASDPDAVPIDSSQITMTNDAANNALIVDFGTLENSDTDNSTIETVTFTYRLRVTDIPSNVQGTTLNNDVELQFDTDSDGTLDGSATASASVDVVEPLLMIDKQLLTSTPLTLGGPAQYQITVELDPNSGADAYDVVIRDTLPPFIASVDNVQIDVTGGGSPEIVDNSAANLLSISISEIDSTTTVTITIDARVTTDPAAIGQTTTNTTVADYTSLDTPEGGDDGDIEREYEVSDQVAADIEAVDLFISKDDGGIDADNPAAPGDTVTYTINYGNRGNLPATGVVITESLPEYVNFDPSENPNWMLNGDTLTFDVGNLAAGENGSVNLVVTIIDPVPAGVEQTSNSVSIDGDESNGSDPTPGDNADSDITPIEAAPDYVAEKTNDFTSPVQPGDPVSWTIEISNQGNQDGTGVVVTDNLPDTSLFTNFTASNGGVIDLNAGTVTWDIGDLAAGDSITLTLSADVADSVPVTIPTQTNTVTVDDDGNNGPDPTPDNNTDNTEFDITYVELSIDKDDGGVSVEPGDTLIYTLTYANNGTQEATGVVITETLPDYTTFDAANSDPRWVQNGNTLTLDLGTLAAGETGSVDFAVVFDNPMPSGVEETSNSTRIEDDGGNGPDQDPDNNTDDETTPIEAAPDYVLDKIENFVDPANPGDTLEWTIVITNEGNQDGTGVVITDDLPSSTVLSNVTASDGGVIDLDRGIVTWDIGDLAAGESVSVTLTAVIPDLVPVSFPLLANTAVVTDDGANGPDPTPENNGDTEQFNIIFVDLVIDKVVNDEDNIAFPGEVVTYTLSYANVGTASAPETRVFELLPANTTFDPTNSTPGWQLENGRYVIDIGEVNPGETGQVQFAVIIDDPLPADFQVFTNVALIDYNDSNGPDQDPANNTTADRDSPAIVVVAAPDYQIDKIENFEDPANPGDTISWTIVASNVGNQNGTGVVVTDQLPDQSLFTDFVASDGGIVDTQAGTVTWNIGNLAAGDSVSLTLTTTVQDQVPANVGAQTNIVTITDDGSNGADPDPSNNSDSETFEIEFVDLFIDKDDKDVEPRPTESIVYTLTYGNRGNATSTGVVITETLPPNTTFDAANSTPGWVRSGDTYTFDVGTLAPGEQGSITFAVTVNYPLDATIQQTENTATIGDDGNHGRDQNPDDNIDTDQTEIENDTNVDNITLSQLYPEYIYPPREWERQAPELHGRLISKETENVSSNLQGGRSGDHYDPVFGSVDGRYYPNDWSRVFGNDLSIDTSAPEDSHKSSPLQMHRDFAGFRDNSIFGDFQRPAASPELPAGAPHWTPEVEPLPSPLQSSPSGDEPLNLNGERSQLQEQLDEIGREMRESRVSPLLAALAQQVAEESGEPQRSE